MAKKIKKLILIGIIAVFPLGILPSLVFTFIDPRLHVVHLLDILTFLYVFVSFYKLTNLRKFLQSKLFIIAIITATSLLFAYIFKSFGSSLGILYLLRLIVYLSFISLLWEEKPLSKEEIVNFLVGNALILVFSGLTQFLLIPDTRNLKYFGWDDHYFRLIGNYLDPGFTGIILVFLIISIFSVWYPRRLIYKYGLLLLLILSLLLTYSRASYLAFCTALFVYFLRAQRGFKLFFLALVLLGAVILVLPRPSSEGVKLERTFSVFLRLKNYEETINIWEKSPIFGVGYNNICELRRINAPRSNTEISHSCSGSDNSFLLILATTGLFGFYAFLKFCYDYIKGKHREYIYPLVSALCIHSFFSNTLFYPWTLVFLAIFLSQSELTPKN